MAHLSSSEQELLNQVKYIDLFGSLTEQKDVAEMFAILLKIRKRLLGDVLESACEGNILDQLANLFIDTFGLEINDDLVDGVR